VFLSRLFSSVDFKTVSGYKTGFTQTGWGFGSETLALTKLLKKALPLIVASECTAQATTNHGQKMALAQALQPSENNLTSSPQVVSFNIASTVNLIQP